MAGPISEHGQGGGFLKPTPAKTVVPTKTVLPPAPKAKAKPSYTAAQEATMHVNQLLAPQYTQAARDAAIQNQAIKGFTQAIIAQLQGEPQQLANIYNPQIQQQGQMANAAADSLRAVNPTGDVSKLLDAVGAPQSQQQQIAGNLNNTFNGGAAVGQYVNGVLPLGALRAQSTAARALAALQPGFEALRGQQGLQSALAQQADTRSKIAQQQPQLVQDWLNQFQSNRAKQQQLALEAQSLGLKTQQQGFTNKVTLAKLKTQQDKYISDYTLRVKEFNAKQTDAAAKAAAPSASLSRATGYLVDSSGKAILDPAGKKQILPGFKQTPKGQVVKVGSSAKAAAMAKPFADLTKTQVGTLRATANELRFGTVYQGKAPVTVNGKTYKPGDTIPPFKYRQAISFLVSKGFSRKNAIAMLNNFYPPGFGGRPTKGQVAASQRVAAANAQARQGKDSSGLGIIVP